MRARLLTVCTLLAVAGMPASASAAPPILQHLPGLPAGRVGLPKVTAQLPVAGQLLGNATDSVDVLVGLRGRDQAGLRRFVAQVSNPRSKRYRHYLSAAAYRRRFSPSPASVAEVRRFAVANGLRVAGVPANRAFVELKGPSPAASRAFATTLRAVKVGSRLAHTPTSRPSVPASLAREVTTVEGLDTTRLVTPRAVTAPPAYVNAGPCSTYWGQKTDTADPGAFGQAHLPWVPCGYTPRQMRSAYGVSSGAAAKLSGKGVTVGIIDAFDYPRAKADATTWSSKHGLPAPDYIDRNPTVPSAIPEVPGSPLDPDGWAGEQMLDIEAVHAMAPKATISFRGTASPLNVSFTRAQNQVVDKHEAQIVSNSYGGAQDDADANTDAVLAQAAATGIGFYFSSGDQGDETQDPNGPGDREVDTSANNPLATAVGGTALAVGSAGQRLFETGWGTYSATLSGGAFGPLAFNSGGGGGTSQSYAEPSYQQGVVPSSIARYFQGKPAEASQAGNGFTPQVPGRAVPDVSMDADPQTGLLIGMTQDYSSAANPGGVALPTDDVRYGEYRIGGTSLSSPLFAGFMALADQAAGAPHGFANPALYAAYRSTPGAFNDVVDPASKKAVIRQSFTNGVDASGGVDTFLRTLNDTNTIHTVRGYDDVTGLGTPRASTLVGALSGR